MKEIAYIIITFSFCSLACSIDNGSSVLLTGGKYSHNRVSEYSETGYQGDLPQLLQGRHNHGCTYFENEYGTKVEINS